MQLVLAMVVGLFLLANLFAVLLIARSPALPAARGPMLLTILVVTLLVSLLCLVLLLRWLLRPYRQLVGEAERAPVAARSGKARDEAEFVLETFQSVVAQLQAQRRELEMLSARASLRADSAEKFSERIVASVPSGLVAFDSKGCATVVNAPARALIEADGQAEGQHLRSLLRNAPDLAEMVEHCLQTGNLYRREEVAATTSNGRTRRLGATVAPIDPTPDQGARGALCLLTDITEVTQLREQVALKRNLESLGEMSAGLAHEFKNALATLHGYAQLMQNLELQEHGRAAAASLLQEVRSLSTMVTAFLNFARPQPLELSDVSLNEIVKDCATELAAFYDERRVALLLEGIFPQVRADERMLRQAILNLLRNAAEAIDEAEARERRVTVQGALSADAAGKEWANIEIRDTGNGLAEADLQRIFIPFFTTKSKGHGVGLALAHRVITDHGGTLSASNAPTGGALFTIRLPL
jgi:nitrogen fixation/metabolism regulation signal transduction histidine kinase